MAYKKPLNNWDAIAYSAVVLQYDHAREVHTEVYNIARQQLPVDSNPLRIATRYG